MANRYWVGGTGTWTTTATANWAATSGGASGASAPTSADNVFFDANSGAGTVTVGATITIKSVDCTGFTGTLAGTSGVSVGGSVTYGAGMSITWSGTLTLTATGTFTSNGKSRGGTTNINGAGATVTLGDAFSTSGTLSVSAGSFLSSGYSVAARGFTSSGTTTRSIDLGSSTVSLTGNLTLTATGLTFNAGSSTINILATGANSFAGGGLTFGIVVIGQATNANAVTVTGSNTFGTLSSTRTVSYSLLFTGGTTQTFTDFSVSGTTGNLVTVGSTNTTSVILQKPSSWNVGANSVDGGSNTGLSFTGSNPDYLSISRITGQVVGGSVSATATVTGAQASTAVQAVQGLGDATSSAPGTEATSGAGSVTALGAGAATASVSGAESQSHWQDVSSTGDSNTTTGGAQAATSAGSVQVSLSASAQVTGTESVASAGTVIALGTGAGVGTVTGAQSSAATGPAAASGQANITATGTQVTITTGAVGVSLSANVNLAGAEARAAAGQVSANNGSVKPGVRVIDYAPRFITKKDGKARVQAVEALALAGHVSAFGQRNVVARVHCAHSAMVRGRVRGRGVQNPSDEDIALMLAI